MQPIVRIMLLFDIYFSFVLSTIFLGFMMFLADNGGDENKIMIMLAVSWVLLLLPFLYIFALV